MPSLSGPVRLPLGSCLFMALAGYSILYCLNTLNTFIKGSSVQPHPVGTRSSAVP